MASPGTGPWTGSPRKRTSPLLGAMSPEMIRNSVDLPDPERPSSPTISPADRLSLASSSTTRGSRPGAPNVLQQLRTSRSADVAGVDISVTSIGAESSFGKSVERAPHGSVKRDHIERHDGNAEDQSWIVSALGCLSNVCTEPVSGQVGVAPARDFGDDARVPRAARRGDGARNVVRKDARQHHVLPPRPTGQAQAGSSFLEIARESGCACDDVEQDVPLRAEHHQRTQPDVGTQVVTHDDDYKDRKHQVGGKGGQELGHRLQRFGKPWPLSYPHSDRNPDQSRQRDEYDDAQKRQ